MSNKKIPFAYFYSWNTPNDAMIPNIMAEFKWHGVNDLVLGNIFLQKALAEPAFWSALRYHANNQQINLIEAHAPCGQHFDLSCPDKGRRAGMIEDHKRAMGYSADSGSKTYTIHIGAFESIFYHTPNEVIRRYAVDTLEQLLPVAEKLGIIIAVENSFERSNTPDEVLYYIEYFNSPWIKCCYDAGHANIMAPAAGKLQEKYTAQLKKAWDNNVIEYPDALEKLAPHIVTCHLHDNDGYGDAHAMPGSGTVDWQKIVPALKKCPNLVSMQTEVSTDSISIGKLVDTFNKIIYAD